jgi:hypothetical protein
VAKSQQSGELTRLQKRIAMGVVPEAVEKELEKPNPIKKPKPDTTELKPYGMGFRKHRGGRAKH